MDETRGLPYTQQLYSRFCKKSFNFHLLNFSIQFCFNQRFGVSKIKISLTTQYYNALLQFENCTLLECARLLNEYAHSTPPRRSPKYTIGRENGKKKTNRSPPRVVCLFKTPLMPPYRLSVLSLPFSVSLRTRVLWSSAAASSLR